MMQTTVSTENRAEAVTRIARVEKKFDATANDSDKSWTVPNNELWRICYVHAILVSTATVGNRQIALEIKDESGNSLMHLEAGAVQAASVTRHYGFLQGIFRETSFVSDELQVPLPIDCWLKPGWSLRVADDAAIDAAADDLTVSFVYEVQNV